MGEWNEKGRRWGHCYGVAKSGWKLGKSHRLEEAHKEGGRDSDVR